MGNSYSIYKGYIPADYDAWYSGDGFADVNRVEQITNIELKKIQKVDGHPDAEGMRQIKEQVKEVIFE